MKWIAALSTALVLSACAEPVYSWSKSGPHSFSADSDGCKADIAKRIKDTPALYAWKNGSAPSERNTEWAQRTYNECMTRLGYTPTRG